MFKIDGGHIFELAHAKTLCNFSAIDKSGWHWHTCIWYKHS